MKVSRKPSLFWAKPQSENRGVSLWKCLGIPRLPAWRTGAGACDPASTVHVPAVEQLPAGDIARCRFYSIDGVCVSVAAEHEFARSPTSFTGLAFMNVKAAAVAGVAENVVASFLGLQLYVVHLLLPFHIFEFCSSFRPEIIAGCFITAACK